MREMQGMSKWKKGHNKADDVVGIYMHTHRYTNISYQCSMDMIVFCVCLIEGGRGEELCCANDLRQAAAWCHKDSIQAGRQEASEQEEKTVKMCACVCIID
jgi:hypothetical protein